MTDRSRPLGPEVEFDGARAPDDAVLPGRAVELHPLVPARHGPALWAQLAGHPALWDYLYEVPPDTEATLIAQLQGAQAKPDWHGYAICVPDGAVTGYAFYLNIVPAMGTIEVGNINFGPALQRSFAATEAMSLMMRNAFALGYRRYEWKCNALNMPSRRAAQRLGFSWEGIFRQHLIVKGRNRDTAWLAMTDDDWAKMGPAHDAWLAHDNFDPAGRQRRSLSDLTAPHLVARDPALHR